MIQKEIENWVYIKRQTLGGYRSPEKGDQSQTYVLFVVIVNEKTPAWGRFWGPHDVGY
jgi:hypothetical protein